MRGGVLALLFMQWTSFVSAEPDRIRGVSEKDSTYYQPLPGNKFKCRDGSATLPYSAVNDDYCDCQDASDEPGTSACITGTFYCQNIGHAPSVISSSRVNDGVCDPECCDGSDEWNSSVKCPNVCQEAGQQHRKKVEAEGRIRKEGWRQRREYIRFGKKAKVDRAAKIKKLEEELKNDAVTLKQLQVTKEIAEKAEESRREAEKVIDFECPFKLEECDRSGTEKLNNIRRAAQEAHEFYDGLDDDYKAKSTLLAAKIREVQYLTGGFVEPDVPIGIEEDENQNADETKNIESSETTPAPIAEPAIPPRIPRIPSIIPQLPPSFPSNTRKEPTKIHPCDDFDVPFTNCVIATVADTVTSLRESVTAPFYWKGWSSLKRSYNKMRGKAPLESIDFAQLSSDATKAKDMYQEFERKKNDKERELEELRKKAENDYGFEGEWESLHGNCFSTDAAEYTYEICIYDKIVQKQKNGVSTDLGHFTRWGGRDTSSTPGNQKYTKMMYENGLMCWSGPSRSTEVTVECGSKNEVISVSEPSKCEYLMHLVSPAACTTKSNFPVEDTATTEEDVFTSDTEEVVADGVKGAAAPVPVNHVEF